MGAIDARLVAARGDDTGLEVVADDLTRDATEEAERVDMAADPVRQALPTSPRRSCSSMTPSAPNEDLRRSHRTGDGIGNRQRLPGKVHKQPFAET
jgi:hypothetical protein